MLRNIPAAGVLALANIGLCKKPNILFVLTDDQDWHMESVGHMPYLKNLIVNQGLTYNQHFCTVSLCCPSRATLWTGLAAHNHNITNVAPPFGGYGKVAENGFNDDNLFLWMQDAGYDTYYVGKLYNYPSVENYNKPYAKGFTGSDFLLDPYTYQYWNGVISHNGGEPASIAGQYSTDVVASRAMAHLDIALHGERPFFMTVAPIAPHSNWVIDIENDLSYLEEPKFAPRHAHLFEDYMIPRDASFNTMVEGGASWVGNLPTLNKTLIDYNDVYQRSRLKALQAVDEMLADLVRKLEDAGELDNTYIFYSTDNGYHLSQHRMLPGKECGYDTDIHIPMFVRGPGVPKKETIDAVTTHTDVASTMLQIAGVSKQLDGVAMPLRNEGKSGSTRHEHATIEYWGPAVPEGHFGGRSDRNREAGQWSNFYMNNTYKGIRLASADLSLYFSTWCTNETEFFDLKSDPYQIKNLAVTEDSTAYVFCGRPLQQVYNRLNALIMVLKTCKGRVCIYPWETLHPDGDVNSLVEALHDSFDEFYSQQPQMYFLECPMGFMAEKENQQPVNTYKAMEEL